MKDSPVVAYVKTSLEELTKVVWPTKSQAVRLSIIVLCTCLVIAILLGVLDLAFNELYKLLLSLRTS
ncbi:preprotein translocase subunit SecE [Candidatus Peregrinibacteria bacterium]|nr:preprotein translocase subunit SecE [Candidatus Peregrinibacteria bacterium]